MAEMGMAEKSPLERCRWSPGAFRSWEGVWPRTSTAICRDPPRFPYEKKVEPAPWEHEAGRSRSGGRRAPGADTLSSTYLKKF